MQKNMNTKINKYDLILIVTLLLITLLSLIFIYKKDKKYKYAYVYYENKLVKKIDLNKDSNYTVKGYNGKVKLVVKNKKIKVSEEKSPKHLCSKRGYISHSYEQIICLPNKIVVEIKTVDNIDTVVK